MGARGTHDGVGLAFLATLGKSLNGCIEYPFGRFSTGYGRVRFGGRPRPAHVVSYLMHVGEIPDGLEVCHGRGNQACVSRACVNPRHLRVDTHKGNMADKVRDGTHHRGSRNGRALLSFQDVARVRRDVAAGVPQNILARDLGVSPPTINRIIRGRGWKYDEMVQD